MSKLSLSRKNKVDPFFQDHEDICAVCRASAAAQRAGRELDVEEFEAAVLQAGKEGAVIGTFDDEDDYSIH